MAAAVEAVMAAEVAVAAVEVEMAMDIGAAAEMATVVEAEAVMGQANTQRPAPLAVEVALVDWVAVRVRPKQ